MAASWQQVLALDARYNAHRAPNHPNFRTLYIRRRSQLLRDAACSPQSDGAGVSAELQAWRRQYLRIRTQLLQQRYGAAAEPGVHSRSMSARSSSQMSESPGLSRCPSQSLSSPASEWSTPKPTRSGVVPTNQAEASRAMVGGTTLEENYAFSGMHRVLEHHSSAITAVEFAHGERRRIAAASLDGTASICDLGGDGAETTVLLVLKGHTGGVTDLHWSLANDLLVTCSVDGTLRLWNPLSGSCLRTVGGANAPSAPQLLCCLFQPTNNNMVVAGSSRGVVQVLNVSTGIALKGGAGKMVGRVLSLAFEAGGEMLWAGDDRGWVASFLFDFASGRLRKAHRLCIREGCPVTCLSARAWVSREARDPSLLVSCAANALFLFRVVDSDGRLQLRRAFPLRHRSQKVKSMFCPIMSFRPGACVVSGSEDCSVYFFDVGREGRPLVNRLQGHAAPVLAVDFSQDEALLATGDATGVIILWTRGGT